MKNIQKYILLFHLLVCCLWAYPSTYALRGVTVSDGLSDLLVNALYKDSLGFVWIGTGNSLERFDGNHIRHYPITGSDEKLKRVNAIAEMAGNQLWIGNGMGLWRLNKEQNALERMVPELINCAVYSLLHDGKETLCIGSAKGLFLYKKGNLEQILLDKNVLSASNIVTGLALGEQGMLWMATRNGLYSLRLSDRKMKAYHNVLGDGKHVCTFSNITCIGSTVYLGTTDQGIISFDTRSGKFEHYVEVGCNIISSLSSDGKNMLYVGTDGNGVHFIETDRRKVVHTLRHETGNGESLRSNSVYSLLVDRDGLVWVGFYQHGLDYTLYQSDLFTTYTFPPYFSSKDIPVRAIFINGHEKLIGSRDGLFYVDEQKKRFKSFPASEMRSGMIFSILYYKGEYYVGTYGGGMYIFDPETLALRDFEPSEPRPFATGHIFCIKQDSEQNLWIGTSQGVFCYRDGKRVAHYTSSNSRLPEGNVYEIYFDSTHKGWICTENGLCIWDPSSGKIRTDIFPEGFIHKEKIRVVYEDSGHNLYFFPDKGSLFFSDLSMDSFRRLHPGTPLEGRDGMFIIEDREGWLWMGTNNGLFHYDKKDHFIPYNFVDGIPSSIFTLCPPVCDAEGNFWFGNSKGLVFLDVARMKRKRTIPYPAKVTDVYVNGKLSVHAMNRDGNGMPQVELELSERNVTFYFSDFSYSSSSFMSYEYRLEGKEKDWQTITGNSEVTYYDLPSGSYVFKVRRMGQPGSETGVSVKIGVAWGYQIFWGIIGLMFLAGGCFYIFRRREKHFSQLMPPVTIEEPVAEVEEPTAALTETPAVAIGKPAVVTEEPIVTETEVPVVVEITGKSIAEEKYKNIKVSSEECRRLSEKLEEVMRKDKLYKHSDLKIADLASAIDTSAHTLSYLFNQYLERNYYDYINDYRIAEFKRLVNEDEYSKYTLGALAELCGFSSRASFFRYFKKATGITPNEYIRGIGKGNE